MNMFWKSKPETDEEYYQRYYQKAQASATYGHACADCSSFQQFIDTYPRSDPTSPQRLRADNKAQAHLWRSVLVGVATAGAASIVAAPIGAIIVGALAVNIFCRKD
jgi:hypothetical protein